MKNKLEWYVLVESNNEIEKFNVFRSLSFYDNLIKLKKKMKSEKMGFDAFSEELRRNAMYSFWSKAEYEIIITNLFCSISKEEVERIRALPNDKMCTYTKLITEKKVDVYDQLSLNWNAFARYTYENI